MLPHILGLSCWYKLTWRCSVNQFIYIAEVHQHCIVVDLVSKSVEISDVSVPYAVARVLEQANKTLGSKHSACLCVSLTACQLPQQPCSRAHQSALQSKLDRYMTLASCTQGEEISLPALSNAGNACLTAAICCGVTLCKHALHIRHKHAHEPAVPQPYLQQLHRQIVYCRAHSCPSQASSHHTSSCLWPGELF